MSKEQLQQRVLDDPRIDIYACGREDIRTGQIDRRVLATLEFLADSDLRPTVSALKCGHSYLTTSGNVSEHTSGDAVDIAAINGTPILDHQGKGSITDTTIQRLLALQGAMKPHQIISLMTPEDFGGADNILSLPDHYNHIHVGFHPDGTTGGADNGLNAAPVAAPDRAAEEHRQPDGADAPVARRDPRRRLIIAQATLDLSKLRSPDSHTAAALRQHTPA